MVLHHSGLGSKNLSPHTGADYWLKFASRQPGSSCVLKIALLACDQVALSNIDIKPQVCPHVQGRMYSLASMRHI